MSSNSVRRFVFSRSVFICRSKTTPNLLDRNDVMRADVFDAGVTFNFLEGLRAPARSEWKKTKLAGLQRFFRVKEIGKERFMRGEHVLLLVQCAANFLLQLL